METSSRSLRNTYNWAQSRIRELTKEVKVKNNHFDFRCVEDATAICQEFDEWLEAKSRKEMNEICLLYTSPSPRDPSISRMPSSA